MKVVTSHFSRELTLEQWSRGKDQALVRRIGRSCVTKLHRTSGCKSGPGKWSERLVADPELEGEIPRAERGVERLSGGSKCTGRNIK